MQWQQTVAMLNSEASNLEQELVFQVSGVTVGSYCLPTSFASQWGDLSEGFAAVLQH